MFMRRRPLLRAAAIGGGAYVVGKRAGERADQQNEGQQGSSQQDSSQQQARQAQAAPAPAAPAASIPDQLNRLSALHDQGALTDAEFASAKSKLLGT
jgi:membrane protease subunit (stomatin/prohibitin family)